MEKISEITKDPNWQKVRKSLLGKWKENPTWCCNQLKQYLGNIRTTDEKKLRIVMNYLTGFGFRMGKIKNQCIQNIRDSISNEKKRRKELHENVIESYLLLIQ